MISLGAFRRRCCLSFCWSGIYSKRCNCSCSLMLRTSTGGYRLPRGCIRPVLLINTSMVVQQPLNQLKEFGRLGLLRVANISFGLYLSIDVGRLIGWLVMTWITRLDVPCVTSRTRQCNTFWWLVSLRGRYGLEL
jgi:hypothetical protein